jgi:hypothetical protein
MFIVPYYNKMAKIQKRGEDLLCASRAVAVFKALKKPHPLTGGAFNKIVCIIALQILKINYPRHCLV